MLKALAAFCSILDNTPPGTYRDVKGVHFGIFIGSEELTGKLGHRTAIRKHTQPSWDKKHPYTGIQLMDNVKLCQWVHAGLNIRAV